MIYRTLLCIETAEPVTPEHIARRVAEACAQYGALRPGEAVRTCRAGADCGDRLVVQERPLNPNDNMPSWLKGHV